MPHITIVTSPHLANVVDWPSVITSMHREIADRRLALLSDLKSRIQRCDYALVGDDAANEQMVATLVMTNQRTDAAQQQMAEIVATHLGRAANKAGAGGKTQCCVFFHTVSKANYLRQDI